MGLRVERYSPAVISGLGVLVYLVFFRSHHLPTTLSSLFAATISIASIAVGFFATAKTAVVQLEPTRPLISKLRKAERYDVFLNYMSTAIHVSFALAVVSAGELLVDFAKLTWPHRIIFAVWLFVALFSGLAYFRVVRVLNTILDSPPN